MNSTGKLFMVATPIGNLDDMTFRAVNCLKEADLIACEDTRHSRILLEYYDIQTKTTSYHEHNKYDKAAELVDLMRQGLHIAAITDAGTPGISDPGEELVRQAVQAGIEVSALPGCSACVTALSMCGLKTRRFVFEGFIPVEKKERKEALSRIEKEERTIVLYEAPHRIRKTLKELEIVIPGRIICICRELTKKYEEVLRFSVEEASAYFEEHDPRGEMVIIIDGMNPEEKKEADTRKWQDMDLKDHMRLYLNGGMTEKEAMKAVAKDLGLSKRDIYEKLKIQ